MISFGPVPSRRLGKSIGINNIPPKYCSFSCVYCQIGRKCNLITERREFYSIETIVSDVSERIKEANIKNEPIDYLTYVSDGEPTLDIHLGEELLALKEFGIKTAVISNSSFINHDDVKNELKNADFVSLKIDTVVESVWKQINRPHRTIDFNEILNGIKEYRRIYKGFFATETMLVSDLNDDYESLSNLVAYLEMLHPDCAYISLPLRPPAEKWVSITDSKKLDLLIMLFKNSGINYKLLFDYEEGAFISTGVAEDDLLSILSVHPMRKNALNNFLISANIEWELIDKLIQTGKIEIKNYNSEVFYIRKTN